MRLAKRLVLVLTILYLIANVSHYDNLGRPHGLIYRDQSGDFISAELFRDGIGTYSNVLNDFDAYKQSIDSPNEVLFRTFTPHWGYLDKHLEYIIHPRWKLPYMKMSNSSKRQY